MRSQKQVEIAIADVRRQINEKKKLQTIATFAGADTLLELFNETKKFYLDAIQILDEGNPALSREYGKNRACLALIKGFIDGMTGAEEAITELKKQFLALNEELGKVLELKATHEKTRM